jgi:hypothetical protein
MTHPHETNAEQIAPLDAGPVLLANPEKADTVAHHVVLADLAQRLPRTADDDADWPEACRAPWLQGAIAQALAGPTAPDTGATIGHTSQNADTQAHHVVLAGLARHVPRTAGNDSGWPEACGAPWLQWMIAQATTQPMAMDKRARWMGYIQGVATARGWLDGTWTIAQAPSEPMDLGQLAIWTGYVQGVATARGWLDVGVERERTRPIFHAAAERAGRPKPATIGAPTTTGTPHG